MLHHPRLRKYAALVHEDLPPPIRAICTNGCSSRRLSASSPVWSITLIAKIILYWMWPPVLRLYLGASAWRSSRAWPRVSPSPV